MMIFKKLFLLICLGLGAFVPGVCANTPIDMQINTLVCKVFKNKPASLDVLKKALSYMKKNVSSMTKDRPGYEELHQALQQLNLENNNLSEVLAQLKVVVALLPKESKELLKSEYPILG